MAQTIIAETNNYGLTAEYQAWCRATAYAENLPTGSAEEVAAWERVNELWAAYVASQNPEATMLDYIQRSTGIKEASVPAAIGAMVATITTLRQECMLARNREARMFGAPAVKTATEDVTPAYYRETIL